MCRIIAESSHRNISKLINNLRKSRQHSDALENIRTVKAQNFIKNNEFHFHSFCLHTGLRHFSGTYFLTTPCQRWTDNKRLKMEWPDRD